MTEYVLKDMVRRVIDNRGKTPPLSPVDTKYPIIEVNAVKGRSPTPATAVFSKWVNEQTYEAWFRSGHPEKGDLIVSTVGSIGEFALHSGVGVIAQNIVGLSFKNNICDSRFAYYLFNNPPNKEKIKNLDISSVQPSIKVPHLLALKFDLPDLCDQKAIARTLGALDDKIELNRQMNKTLEEIAKTLFKSWFIDFDPVRAKAEGKPTGLPKEISDLFPDSFEDSELGKIPKGWKVKQLGFFTKPKRGKTITKNKATPGDIPVVAGGLKPSYYHNESNVKPPVVTISSSGRNAGFTRLYHQDIWASDCSFISNNQSSTPYMWYLFLKINQDKLYHMQHGAVQEHINPADIMSMELCYPEQEKIWKRLNDYITSVFKRIAVVEKEIKILSDLRDTLLPQLISGKLRIPDAEKYVEEAGV